MSGDRRRYQREPRFLRLKFEWDSLSICGITTNVSEGGAFLNVSEFPPIGTVLELVHEAVDDVPEVRFTGIVQRVVDPLRRISVVPGIGVRWLLASCMDGAEALRVALRQLVDIDTPEVVEDDDGRGIWRPPPLAEEDQEPKGARVDQVRLDLARIEDVRPIVDRDMCPLPKPGERLERREADRAPVGTQVTCYINRTPLQGHVNNLSLRGMWVRTDETLPQTGDVMTVRYPVGTAMDAIEWIRLVGVVVRIGTGNGQGFGVEFISVDNLGTPNLFENHVNSLSPRRKKGGIRIRVGDNVRSFPRA